MGPTVRVRVPGCKRGRRFAPSHGTCLWTFHGPKVLVDPGGWEYITLRLHGASEYKPSGALPA